MQGGCGPTAREIGGQLTAFGDCVNITINVIHNIQNDM
jgi:hypothetical protein